MHSQNSNKSIVLNFYKRVIGERDSEYAKQIITEDYIQHNPMVKTGLIGLLETLEFLKQIPQPPNPPKPFMRLLAEDEYVIVHMEVEVMGSKKAVLDIFKLENGLITEHWDGIQDIPPSSLNDNPMVRGTTDIQNLSLSAEHKKIVRTYTEKVLIKGKWKTANKYLAHDLIQHNPVISNGVASLKTYYEGVKVIEAPKIIAEGNFVCTQTRAHIQGVENVIYDLYRLEDGKIVEHWAVSQEIPETMAHENGMI